MLLAPPSHFKSTVFVQILVIALLLADPNETILITRETQRVTKDLVWNLGQMIKSDAFLREMLYDPKQPMSEERIVVRRDIKTEQPSIMAASWETSIVSKHAGIHLIDDLVGFSDMSEEKTREKKLNFVLGPAMRALGPGARILITGHRWHDQDVYGRILSFAEERKWDIKTYKGMDAGKPLDPTIMTAEQHEEKRRDMGTQLYECMFNQNTSAMSGKFFNWNWFRFYDHLPEMDLKAQGIDLAISKKETADYTVIATWGVKDGNFYLLHIRRGHWGIKKQLKEAEEEADAWEPTKRAAEANQYQAAFVELAEEPSKWPIEAVHAHKDKVTRARKMQALAEAGKLFIPNPESCPWAKAFMVECTSFPGGEKDDMVDASVYGLHLLQKPGYKPARASGSGGPIIRRITDDYGFGR